MRKMAFCLAATLVAATVFNGAEAYAGSADIVFVVDESGSMPSSQTWIGTILGSLDSELVAAGITNNRYAFVGFGSNTIAGRHVYMNGGATWGDATLAAASVGNFVDNGGTEDGYEGLNFAMTQLTYRQGVAKNLILLTDEDRDNWRTSLNFGNIESSLEAGNFLLNAVVNATYRHTGSGTTNGLGLLQDDTVYLPDGSGGYTTQAGPGGYVYSDSGTTTQDYVNLAHAADVNGRFGAAWDINQLRNNVQTTADSFTAAFIDVKVSEIQAQIVPVPAAVWGGMVLLGGIGSVRAWRRRRAA